MCYHDPVQTQQINHLTWQDIITTIRPCLTNSPIFSQKILPPDVSPETDEPEYNQKQPKAPPITPKNPTNTEPNIGQKLTRKQLPPNHIQCPHWLYPTPYNSNLRHRIRSIPQMLTKSNYQIIIFIP